VAPTIVPLYTVASTYVINITEVERWVWNIMNYAAREAMRELPLGYHIFNSAQLISAQYSLASVLGYFSPHAAICNVGSSSGVFDHPSLQIAAR